MTEEQTIDLWKSLKIAKCDFEFSCGGDSMNDTTVRLYENNIEIENEELESAITNIVYNNVDFYVNSDGQYLGEYGTVYITLNEEGNEFLYDKDTTEEYSEILDIKLNISLTPKYKKFIKDYVDNVNGDSDSVNVNFNYKKDFIMTDEMEDLIVKLSDYILKKINNNTEIDTYDYDFDENYHFDSGRDIVLSKEGLELTVSYFYLNLVKP